MWSGTAESFVNMNPPEAQHAQLFGVDAGFQVGSAYMYAFGNVSEYAGIWSGTRESFVNLHSFLTPSTYHGSVATDVWTDGVSIKVVGHAYTFYSVGGSFLRHTEALLWTLTIPEPGSFIFAPALISPPLLLMRSRRSR
jgi:hypothetical protein